MMPRAKLLWLKPSLRFLTLWGPLVFVIASTFNRIDEDYSAVRGRRTRTAGAGGFTTRLRRRTPAADATTGAGDSDVMPVETSGDGAETEG